MSEDWTANCFAKMNPEQIEVITHDLGPCLVTACAGSGKTTAVVRRMAYLTKVRGVDPKRILGTTFSKDAQKAMNERVRALTGDDSIRVQTFHAFCRNVLATELHDFDNWHLDESDGLYRTMLKRAIGYEHMDWKGADVEKIKSFVEAMKASAIRPDNPDIVRIALPRFPHQTEMMAEAYRVAEDLRVDSRIMTFSDWLVDVYYLFARDEAARVRWAEKFDYLIVDEAQDNNPVQSGIVEQLGREHRSVMMIGDENQSIFGFRAASPELFTGFVETWNARRITMHRNYRSVIAVVDAANVALSLMSQEAQSFSREMTATRDHPGLVTVAKYSTQEVEAEGVVNNILALYEDGEKYNNCVILYRTNMLSRSLEEVLIRKKVPYQIIGSSSFYTRSEVSTLLAYLKVANGSDAHDDVWRTMINPKRFLGKKFMDQIDAAWKDQPQSYAQLVDIAISYKKLGGSQPAQAYKWAGLIDDLRAKRWSPAAALTLVIDRTKFNDWLREEEGHETSENDRVSNVAELVRAAASFDTISAFLTHVDQQIKAFKDNKKEPLIDKVTLMSCHRSKGLEWPHVFLIMCNDNVMPHVWAKTMREAEEEKRIFYVAITRAKETLDISYVEKAVSKGKIRELDPSPFLVPIMASKKVNVFLQREDDDPADDYVPDTDADVCDGDEEQEWVDR